MEVVFEDWDEGGVVAVCGEVFFVAVCRGGFGFEEEDGGRGGVEGELRWHFVFLFVISLIVFLFGGC